MAKGVGVFKRKRSIKALYRFFKNESLRFYLYDVINLESSVIKKGHLKYNPFVIYLMRKHNFIFLNNTKWWSMNRHNLKTDWILDELVEYWNKKQERKLLNVDQVREMITTSFKLMLANPDDYNPRYVQFEHKQNLVEYFKVYFNCQEYDSDDSDNEIDNIEEPEHNVVEDNQNENDNDNNEVTEEYLDEFYDDSHVNDLEYGRNTDLEYGHNKDVEMNNNIHDLEYGHNADLEYGHNKDVEMKNNVHDLEYDHDTEIINNSNDLEYGHNTDLEYGHNTDNDVKMIKNVNDRENDNDNFEVIEEYLDEFYDDNNVHDLEYGHDKTNVNENKGTLTIQEAEQNFMFCSYDFLKTQMVSSMPSSSSLKTKTALFNDSILYQKGIDGQIMFDSNDLYPYWRLDLLCPMHGSSSFNNLKLSGNAIRNSNPMFPMLRKIFSDDYFPLGRTALIAFDSHLRLPKYSFQLLELQRWEEFQNSDKKRLRRKCNNFRANFNFQKFLQKYPAVYIDADRGHLTPHAAACCPEDQDDFQFQGNMFPQNKQQNRGKWKKLELSIPSRIKNYGATSAHITTGVIYARDGDNFIIHNEVVAVEYYFKTIFYTDGNGKIIGIDCFVIRQFPIAEYEVSQVTLSYLDGLINNHYRFLNKNVVLPIELENIHKIPTILQKI